MPANDTDHGQDEPRIVDKRAAARMGDGDEPQANDEPTTDTGIEELRARADEYYKNWQRSAADFINFKRRVEQERSETARLATAALIINLLPIYDDMDRANSNVDASLAGLNWVQGVMAIQRKFGSLLESMGVNEVAAEGESFDPAHHEAVGRQPGDEGKVIHVVQKGYQLGDRVIRPAMVIVGDGNAGQTAAEQ